MKNNRNAILKMVSFITIAAIIGFSMTSCEFLIDLLHDHEYNVIWSYDETQHWHECIVCGDKKDVGIHTGTLTGTACYVCFKPHEHKFNETWATNGTQHWKSCVCGERSEIASHDYDVPYSKDATYHWRECSVCSLKNVATAHSYNNTWVKNATQHWHECACGEKKDIASHTGDPCTSCYYIIDPSKALNGTWTTPLVEGATDIEMTYNNGIYGYILVPKEGAIVPEYKGTYTVNDGKITTTITHVYGQGLTGLFVLGMSFSLMFEDWEMLEAEWYTKDQIRARMDAATISSLYGEDEDPWTLAIEAIDALYGPQTQDYSIIGNTLTLTSENEEGEVKTNTYTRKQL